MNKWFVIATLVLAAVFIAVIAKADFPTPVKRAMDIVEQQGTTRQSLNDDGEMVTFKDVSCDYTFMNGDGQEIGVQLYMAYDNKDMLGVGICLKGLIAILVIYEPDTGQALSYDLNTGDITDMTPEQALAFINDVVNLWEKHCGASI